MARRVSPPQPSSNGALDVAGEWAGGQRNIAAKYERTQWLTGSLSGPRGVAQLG